LIPFTKAHACGNDFLIVSEEAATGHDWADLTRRLCARNTGVGADGIEFFAWMGLNCGRIRLHNADGSIAEISGNGTRCAAAWMAWSLGSAPGDELRLETDAGLRVCRVNAIHDARGYSVDVTTAMGVPTVSAQSVQLRSGTRIAGAAISIGNPHFVIVVDNSAFAVADRRWEAVGEEICCHPDFPKQTNVEFVRVLGPDRIEIRIFERGVGPTMSSGTGSSAAAAAALALYGCTSPLTVDAPGGAQTVESSGPGCELFLTGPATLIANGEAW
jgi:diaminopimelate epimerase